jgi:hypothetical protein
MDEQELNKQKLIAEQEFIAQKKLELYGMDTKAFIEDIISQPGAGLGMLIDRNETLRASNRGEDLSDVVSAFQKSIPTILIQLEVAKGLFEKGALYPYAVFNAGSMQEVIDFFGKNLSLNTEPEIKIFLQELSAKIKDLKVEKKE